MPWPVANLLNRPLITLILVLTGSSTCKVLPNSIAAPEPLAHQWSRLTPHPMNITAKRLGKTAQQSPVSHDGSAARAESDGSHGSAIVTPTPRRNARREIPRILSEYGFAVGFIAARNLATNPHSRKYYFQIQSTTRAHGLGLARILRSIKPAEAQAKQGANQRSEGEGNRAAQAFLGKFVPHIQAA